MGVRLIFERDKAAASLIIGRLEDLIAFVDRVVSKL